MQTRNVNQRQELRDLREHHRYAVAETTLRVIWLDANGDLKMENFARPIDVSETGMAVELPEAALLLSRIRLESDKGELLGQGKVRYCHIGFELLGSFVCSAPTLCLEGEPLGNLSPCASVAHRSGRQ